MKTVVITGAGTEVGQSIVEKFSKEKWGTESFNVIAAMKDLANGEQIAKLENVKIVELDVTNLGAIEALMHSIDKVDILINNANYALIGPLELSTDEQIRAEFDVNVFGTLNVTRTFLPLIRESNGVIINISSKGDSPLMSLYNSSRFAIEGLSASLVHELTPYNVRVKVVEVGYTATSFGNANFSQGLMIADNPYSDIMEEFQKAVMSPEFTDSFSSPSTVADTIFNAACDESERVYYAVGDCSTQLMLLKRNFGSEKTLL
ncbi:MAG: hypothetical protein BEN18_05060 [Epulopiscium sp. Nuni2H_MBin001]|nr:MAG: hypothetical protein BEN18_05060 [Epulopiscium sp. Nuni2H_MBin001]